MSKVQAKMAIEDLHIILIVDQSGSMQEIRSDIRHAINKFIRDQQELGEDQSTLTLVKFADEVSHIYQKRPLRHVKVLAEEDYQPDGSTALYDAVGMTLNKYDQDKQVCVVIVTDGEENASRIFNQKTVKEMIAKKQDAGWKFIYLSADITTAKQGDKLSMQSCAANVASTGCNNLAVGYRGLASNLEKACNTAVGELRRRGVMKGMGSGSKRA